MSEELTATAAPESAATEMTVDAYAEAAKLMEANWPKDDAASETAAEEPQTETSQLPGDGQDPSGLDSAEEKSGEAEAEAGLGNEAAGIETGAWKPSDVESGLAESYGIPKEQLQEFGSSAALNAALSLWDKQFSKLGKEWMSGQGPELPAIAEPPQLPTANEPQEDEFADEFDDEGKAVRDAIKQRDFYKASYERLMAQQQQAEAEQRAQSARAAEEAVDAVFQEAKDLKDLFGEGPRGKLTSPAHLSARREIQQEMLAITAGRLRMGLQPLSVKDAFDRAVYAVYGPQLQRKAAESAAAAAKRDVTESIKQQARDNQGRFTKPPLHRPAPEVKSYEAAARYAKEHWGG